ncbi:MAG: serine/threonine protein kinase [Phycisphaerae bacterium]|nr:serine/threonine protein kinase [Phycisphaerae bacterium]
MTEANRGPVDETRVITIASDVLELPEAQREPAIASMCRDPVLAERVRAVVHADAACSEILGEAPILDLPELRSARHHGLSPGRSIGHYRVLALLGAGSMGDVYEAESSAGERVAIKLVRPGVLHPELRRRFEFEAATLSRLRHSNIARLIGTGVLHDGEDERPYMILELVRGPTIAEFVSARVPEPRELLAMFAKVCGAVEHAHRSGVIHRDLKPANILVEEATGEPKVVDFGIARGVDVGATLSTAPGHGLLGSAAYMSPEQASGRDVDTRSDVYALGIVLYELVAGRPAFEAKGKRLLELIREVRDQAPPPVDGLERFGGMGRDLRVVIEHAIARNVEDRYQAVGALATDIRRVISGSPISIRPPSVWQAVRASARRNRRMVAFSSVMAAVLLAVSSLAVVLAIRAHDAEARAEHLVDELVRGSDTLVVKLNQRLREERQPLEARRAVLEAAREYLRSVEVRAADDPRVLEAIALVYLELGRVVGGTSSGSLGETDAAAEFFETSARMYEALLARGDTDARRVGLAGALEEFSIMAGRPPAPELMKRAAAHIEVVASRTPGPPGSDYRAHALRLRTEAAGHSGDVATLRGLESLLAAECDAAPHSEERWSALGQAQQYLAEMLAVTDRPAALRAARACRDSVTRAMSLGNSCRRENLRNHSMNEVIIAFLSAGEAPAEQLLGSAESAVDSMCHLAAEDFTDNFLRGVHVQLLMTFATAGERIANAAPPPGQALSRERIAARVATGIREELHYVDYNRPASLVPYPHESDVLRALGAALERLDAIAAGRDRSGATSQR